MQTSKQSDLIRSVISNKEEHDMSLKLNPENTFENFNVNESNKEAYEAAIDTAKMNWHGQLFIYGEDETSKRQLLEAIGNYRVQNTPNYRVDYITSKELLDKCMSVIKENFPEGTFHDQDNFENNERIDHKYGFQDQYFFNSDNLSNEDLQFPHLKESKRYSSYNQDDFQRLYMFSLSGVDPLGKDTLTVGNSELFSGNLMLIADADYLINLLLSSYEELRDRFGEQKAKLIKYSLVLTHLVIEHKKIVITSQENSDLPPLKFFLTSHNKGPALRWSPDPEQQRKYEIEYKKSMRRIKESYSVKVVRV